MAIVREDNGDARASSATQYALSVGDILHGTLNPVNDKDWFRVELTAGTIYDFILEGVESAQLEILDARGNRVAEGQNFFSYTKLKIFSPDTSGTYYIVIGSNNTGHTANYELSFEENPITTVDHEEIAGYMSLQFPGVQAFDVAAGGVLTANITALNEAGQQLARWALEAWSNVTGIEFEFVAGDDAQITFDDNMDRDDLGAYAIRSTSEGFIVSAFVNVPAESLPRSGAAIDNYYFYVYLHEVGHTLGLGHPGPYDAQFPASIDKIFLNDSWQTTVMSYFHQEEDDFVDADYALPVTPMVADIIAIQSLYGVPVDINPGDTVYGYGSNVEGYLGELFEHWSGEGGSSFDNPVTLTLYDSGGIDTLDLRTDSANQRVDLRPEGFSNVYGLTGNLIIARDTLIENYVAGSGDDVVTGNAVTNYLEGRDGDDDLRGSGGNDILEGGAGADRLDGGFGSDTVTYRNSNAAVTVNLADGALMGGHAEGDKLFNIEIVEGSGYDDVLTGDGGSNRLYGGGGNDVLDGGEGIDLLDGGAGVDTVSYENFSEGILVNLLFNRGSRNDYNDRSEEIVNIENVIGSDYLDSIRGDSGENDLYGRGGDDELNGGAGNDRLFGEDGDDELWGLSGADRFIFEHSNGDDIILDFTDNEDLIDLSAFGLSGFDDLVLSSDANGVTIDMTTSGGGSILLEGFDIANLDASDFIF